MRNILAAASLVAMVSSAALPQSVETRDTAWVEGLATDCIDTCNTNGTPNVRSNYWLLDFLRPEQILDRSSKESSGRGCCYGRPHSLLNGGIFFTTRANSQSADGLLRSMHSVQRFRCGQLHSQVRCRRLGNPLGQTARARPGGLCCHELGAPPGSCTARRAVETGQFAVLDLSYSEEYKKIKIKRRQFVMLQVSDLVTDSPRTRSMFVVDPYAAIARFLFDSSRWGLIMRGQGGFYAAQKRPFGRDCG